MSVIMSNCMKCATHCGVIYYKCDFGFTVPLTDFDVILTLSLMYVSVFVLCVFDPVASSEEELSSSLRPRALTHKAHSEILRSEVRYDNYTRAHTCTHTHTH